MLNMSTMWSWIRSLKIKTRFIWVSSRVSSSSAARCPVSLNVWKDGARSLPLTSQFHEGKMAAALERSFIEICGFERETLHRFREVAVNLGKLPHRLLIAQSLSTELHKFESTRGSNAFTCRRRLTPLARRSVSLACCVGAWLRVRACFWTGKQSEPVNWTLVSSWAHWHLRLCPE